MRRMRIASNLDESFSLLREWQQAKDRPQNKTTDLEPF